MKYRNSVAVISTRKGSVVGSHFIYSNGYRKLNPEQFDYKEYGCDFFEICENVGGKIIVNMVEKLEHSGIEVKNTITFSNVVDISILSEHDV